MLKIVGKYGFPEYGCGDINFPDFLWVMSTDSSVTEESCLYYQSCANVTLDCQVGNWRFNSNCKCIHIFFIEVRVQLLT